MTVLGVFPSARPLPDAVRASLEAVKAAQLAARERARRETRQARIVVTGVAAVVAICGLVVWPRLHGGKAASAATTTVHPARTPASTETQPAATVPAPGGLLAAGVADLPITKESPAAAAAGAASLAACRDSYQEKRWRAAAAACGEAFAAHPDDARLALRVAEAEYARDHLPEAREWAQRTLALDDKQADALAILGRSEQRTGHGDAAARAFRRYLALAPRGWHATEARAALHRDHASARPAIPAVAAASSVGQPREHAASVASGLPQATAHPSEAPVPTVPAPFDPPALAPGPAP